MKPKLIDRILLAIMMIITSALSLFFLAIAFRLIKLENFSPVADYIFGPDFLNALTVGLVGAVLLVVSLRLLFSRNKPKDTAGAKQPYTIVEATDSGKTTISASAIDTMVKRHCKGYDRIKDCTTNVAVTQEGISIGLKCSLLPETNIPEISASIQKSLKEYLEQYCGVTIKTITVDIIESVAQ